MQISAVKYSCTVSGEGLMNVIALQSFKETIRPVNKQRTSSPHDVMCKGYLLVPTCVLLKKHGLKAVDTIGNYSE